MDVQITGEKSHTCTGFVLLKAWCSTISISRKELLLHSTTTTMEGNTLALYNEDETEFMDCFVLFHESDGDDEFIILQEPEYKFVNLCYMICVIFLLTILSNGSCSRGLCRCTCHESSLRTRSSQVQLAYLKEDIDLFRVPEESLSNNIPNWDGSVIYPAWHVVTDHESRLAHD